MTCDLRVCGVYAPVLNIKHDEADDEHQQQQRHGDGQRHGR